MLTTGTRVARYTILDQLGEGAMGEVYRAFDSALDRVVALKILIPMRATSTVARRRFEREARMAARINHPAVAQIYDVGEFAESPFIAMEFVPGRQLRSEMSSKTPPSRVVFLARQILDGLAEAHRQGLIHRDLKPENILISGRDQVKMVDFGLAKPLAEDDADNLSLSTTGLTGTPRYMAPEQVQGHPLDARTDIYALGAILYEMISGRPAHVGSMLGELLMSVVHKPTPDLPPDLCQPDLARAVKCALEKAPEKRFSTAEAMREALSAIGDSDLRPTALRRSAHVPHPMAVLYAGRAREALSGIGNSWSVAAEMLERSLEIDDEYALAHAVLAEACAAAFCTGHVEAKALDRSQASLDRAEELDPGLPDLRVARARMLWNKTFNFPHETALRELGLALSSEPDHAGALRLFATISAHVGLFEVAEAAVERRRRSDPGDPVMRPLVAELAIARNLPEQAVDALADALREDRAHEEPIHWWLYAHAQVLLGNLDEADARTRVAFALRPNDPLLLSISAVIGALRNDADGARLLIEAAEAQVRSELHPHHTYHLIACALSILGDLDGALTWLKRAADEGMPCWTWFHADPLLEKLRLSSQGAAFMRDLRRRYEYYWREFGGALSEPPIRIRA